ncbi:MAG: transporter substrate-binding domain-containing protein [Bacteroidota bacterium]
MIRLLFILFLNLSQLSTVWAQQAKDTLLVAYTPASPFVIDETEAELEGISVWLWEQCAKELDLHYQFVPLPFHAILDSLESGGIDLSINPLTITSQRLKRFRFTHPFFASHSVVVKSHLSPLERLSSFLSSFFSLSVLSGLLALFSLIGIFGFLEWYFERRVNPQHFRRGWKGVWDGLWWSVVTMTTVGYGDKTPKSRGGKIVALIWMFSGLLFISGLTASVASSLTINQLASDTTVLEDFKDRRIGTIAQTSSEEYLRNQFFRKVDILPNVPTGLEQLLNHQIDAFFYDEPIVRYHLKKNEQYASLHVLPNKFGVAFYAFALPKKQFELNEAVSQKVIEITESDVWQKVLHEYGCTIE